MSGQVRLATTESVHHVDLAVSVALAFEGDAAPVGRPVALDVDAGVLGQLHLLAAVAEHREDLGLAVTVAREARSSR